MSLKKLADRMRVHIKKEGDHYVMWEELEYYLESGWTRDELEELAYGIISLLAGEEK
jgi:hypothetical protein